MPITFLLQTQTLVYAPIIDHIQVRGAIKKILRVILHRTQCFWFLHKILTCSMVFFYPDSHVNKNFLQCYSRQLLHVHQSMLMLFNCLKAIVIHIHVQLHFNGENRRSYLLSRSQIQQNLLFNTHSSI